MKEVYIGSLEFLQAWGKLMRLSDRRDKLETFARVAPAIVVLLACMATFTANVVPTAIWMSLAAAEYVVVIVQIVAWARVSSIDKERQKLMALITDAKEPDILVVQPIEDEDDTCLCLDGQNCLPDTEGKPPL